MLAVNHKFILNQRPEDHDVERAKKWLARSVRNRWAFRGKTDEDFIPKFHVANPKWNPPKASQPIEQGLEEAMAVIDEQVRQALSTISSRPAAFRSLNWNRVQEYLQKHGYLVKLTDKNLGLAVFPATWYDANTLVMLSDTNTYRMVDSIPIRQIRDKLMSELSSWRLPPNMEKYIDKKTLDEVPEFHTIPKVHKEPWKLRPIVPSHSWVTSTTSTVLDHLCQPLLEHLPWVVSSSKEVINLIEQVRVNSSEPVWIITGDVTACYSNIPPRDCSSVIAGMWKKYRRDSKIPSAAIGKMARFIMENNYLQYQEQAYHQINGLAMGTACAPCLANIYMGYYERKGRVMYQDGVLLYVRYIDDILCLFQGTEEEAHAFTSRVKLGKLSIVWSGNKLRNEFLDIELIREQDIGLRAVHTRLFRKQMNRHLYIPWSSAHPLPVKKGFVKAELTRFAMLCSKFEYFADARKEFYGNLRRRGYPPQTLDKWFLQVQYGSRPVILQREKPKEFDRAPLMLPGHYNPVWDFVNVKEIITAARRFWTKEELPESLQEPLIRSLSKTTSLFELLSAWNKTILLSSSTVGPAVLTPVKEPHREVVIRRDADL